MMDTIATPTAERAAGTIYDLGYQHYDGPRYGRFHVIRTLASYSFAAAFGRGRGSRAQMLPAVITVLVFLPAVIQVGMASALGNPAVITYPAYMSMVMFFLALFAAAQSPEVIVADRQYGVLSLYLSRSLHKMDYVIAKIIAFTGAMLVLTLTPQLMLFVGKVFVSADPWGTFTSTWKDLGPIFGGTFLAACYMSFVGLALASFAARRAYASATVMGFFVLSPAVASIVRIMIQTEENRRYTALGNPFFVMTGFANWLWDVQKNIKDVPNQFGARGFARSVARAQLPGHDYLWVILGSCAVALVLLALRYRKVEV